MLTHRRQMHAALRTIAAIPYSTAESEYVVSFDTAGTQQYHPVVGSAFGPGLRSRPFIRMCMKSYRPGSECVVYNSGIVFIRYDGGACGRRANTFVADNGYIWTAQVSVNTPRGVKFMWKMGDVKFDNVLRMHNILTAISAYIDKRSLCRLQLVNRNTCSAISLAMSEQY